MHEIIADGQDRTKGEFGGRLTRKLAVNAGSLVGELYPRHEKQPKKPVKRLVIDLKLLKIIIRFEECN